jgi:hypothetical protein
MADATKPYVVRSGDYLTSIAHCYGVKPDDIWNHPSNAALRQQRANPEVLAPGDVLFVPAVQRKWLAADVGSTNTFVATVPTVSVDLQLSQDDGQGNNALAGAAYVIQGLPGGDLQGTIGNDTVISFQVPVYLSEVTLVLPDLQTVYPVRLGCIDPVETDSGLRRRLVHLGYADDPEESYSLEDAISAFQRESKLDESGSMDAATAKALIDAHGS